MIKGGRLLFISDGRTDEGRNTGTVARFPEFQTRHRLRTPTRSMIVVSLIFVGVWSVLLQPSRVAGFAGLHKSSATLSLRGRRTRTTSLQAVTFKAQCPGTTYSREQLNKWTHEIGPKRQEWSSVRDAAHVLEEEAKQLRQQAKHLDEEVLKSWTPLKDEAALRKEVEECLKKS